MSFLHQTLFLMSCISLVPACVYYSDYPADYYDVDPSSVVFPGISTSVFNTPSRSHIFADEVDLKKQYLSAVDAIFALTTRLKVLLKRDTNRNVLVSPVSSTLAIAEILLGARGPSRQHLLNILTTVNRAKEENEISVAEFHHQLGGLLKLLQSNPEYDDAYELHLASAIFMDPQLKLLPKFQTAISELYGANLFPLNFSSDPEGSLKVINEWASLHTRGVIDKVYTQPLPKFTAAVLTNAIYFKGDWEVPFNPRFTIEGKFKTNETHEVDVQYMRGQFDLMYTENKRLDCRMIGIPYKHAKAAMYIILPNKEDLYDIQSFTAALSVQDVRELISSTKLASVSLLMPKMTLTHTFSMRDALNRYRKQMESEMKPKTEKQYRILKANNNTYDQPQEYNTESTEIQAIESTTLPTCLGSNCSDCLEPSCNSTTEVNLDSLQASNSSEQDILNSVETGSSSTQEDLDSVHGDGASNATENAEIEEEVSVSFNLSGASPDSNFRVDDVIQNIFLEINEVGTIAAAVGATTVDYIGEYRNFKIDRPFVFFIRQEITGTPLFWGTIVDPTDGNET